MNEFPRVIAIFNDVGGGEVIVIGIVALLLFGKDLPAVTRKFGKVYGEIKKTLSDASSEIRREMDAAAHSVDDATKDLKNVTKDVKWTPSSLLDLPVVNPPPAQPTLAPPPASIPQNGNGQNNYGSVPHDAPRSLPRTISASAALDTYQREVVPPTKIPPPV